MKSFQLPLTDIKIDDIMKRQMLNLPEINKNKEVTDPLLSKQNKKMHSINPLSNINDEYAL